MKIYLAGAINGTSWQECADWRSVATRLLTDAGHTVLSPLAGKGRLKGRELIKGAEDWTYREIINRDLMMVQQADLILAEYTRPEHRYIGTVSEIAIAYSQGKPVILWHGDNTPESWLQHLPVRGFECLHEAIDYILDYWTF